MLQEVVVGIFTKGGNCYGRVGGWRSTYTGRWTDMSCSQIGDQALGETKGLLRDSWSNLL